MLIADQVEPPGAHKTLLATSENIVTNLYLVAKSKLVNFANLLFFSEHASNTVRARGRHKGQKTRML